MNEKPTTLSVHDLIGAHARSLADMLKEHRHQLFSPDDEKTLRTFLPAEVAKFVGVNTAYLRRLAIDGKGPSPKVSSGGHRSYTAQDMQELREFLQKNTKGGRRYLPHRTADEKLQVITVVNFKGGSGKTTTAAHLSQHLALKGYRVLAIDLDPQASLSALHGLQAEFDVGEGDTIYGAIRYRPERRPMIDVIRKTYFPNLDIVPANIELMEFEHETPIALSQEDKLETMFFTRLDEAIATVADDYDVVVIDCPPQLGFLTMSALCAATAILVTVHPQMLDVMSMCQFLRMTSDLLEAVAGAGGNMSVDWLRYLITRYEPGDSPQNQMVSFMRSMFGDHVLNYPALKSTAVSDAGISNQTLYEITRKEFNPKTYDRAMESLMNVNNEIEELIRKTWGRVNDGA